MGCPPGWRAGVTKAPPKALEENNKYFSCFLFGIGRNIRQYGYKQWNIGFCADSSYTGVTLAQIQAPGGGLAPYFDGTGDYVDTKTDTLNANFNHSIGTMSFWVKISLPDVWDDSSGANLWANAFINGAHTISFGKVPSYMARAEYYDGVDFTVRYDFNPNTYEWILLASTWTTAGQQFIAYKNGVALGAPLFIDSGPSDDLTTSNIGNQFIGYFAHVALWDRVLSVAEILELYDRCIDYSNPTLDEHYSITVQDATQAQTAENVALSAHYSITTQDATQTQTSENVVLTQHEVYSLAVNDSTQIQTSENIALTQHHVLAINDAIQIQTSDNVNIGGGGLPIYFMHYKRLRSR